MGKFHFTSTKAVCGGRYFTISARKLSHIRRKPNSEATITFDLVYNDDEFTYAMLILKDEHYLGKAEFEAIKSVIEDAFWLDFTFFICYNKGRICE